MKKKTTIILLTALSLLFCGALAAGGRLVALASSSIDEIAAEAEASDDPLQTYRDKQAEIMEQLDALSAQIQEQKNLVSGLQSDIAAIDAQMTVINQQLIAAQQAIDQTNAIIEELDQQIADAEERLELRMELLEQRLVDVYVYGDISLLDVIFETASFNDFTTLYDMVELIVEQDKSLADQITAEREGIEADKAKQVEYLAELVTLQQEYADKQYDLRQMEQQKNAQLDEANMTIAQYRAYEDSLEATAKAASEKIRELLASSDSTLSFGGALIWPLPSAYGESCITSPYGWRKHPIYGDNRFHTGIDIGAPSGTQIYAAAEGKIILREYYGGYGNCIMIDHGNGVVSLYGHQSAFGDFKVGDYVVTGDIIGYVGTTGTSTGNHLHFEVDVNGSSVDPWTYLK